MEKHLKRVLIRLGSEYILLIVVTLVLSHFKPTSIKQL